jgi:hypothetical protein
MSTLKLTNIAHPSSASNNIVLDSSGRVAIGTTPDSLFQVAGAANIRIAYNGTSVNYLDADSNIFRSGNGVERGRWDSNGRFLVGTSSASLGQLVSYKIGSGLQASEPQLTVQNNVTDGSSGDGPGINFANASGSVANIGIGGNGNIYFSNRSSSTGSWAERVRIDNTGILLVGTNAASGSAVIQTNAGTTSARFAANTIFDYPIVQIKSGRAGSGFTGTLIDFKRDTEVTIGSITGTGSAVAYNTSSDYRLKENVVPLTGAVDRLNQLQVHRFNFIADPDKTVDGFIAHEAQAVVPECVTGEKDAVDADGNPVYQGIDQSKLVPLLTAALQEAIGRIEALEAKVAALEAA